MTKYRPYAGNIPSNVNQDAKYSVVSDPSDETDWVVRLIFTVGQNEEAFLTPPAHPSLVDKVNRVKVDVQGAPGGAFYINEYGHVLVPAGEECYCAGTHDDLLEFDFRKATISTEPPDD